MNIPSKHLRWKMWENIWDDAKNAGKKEGASHSWLRSSTSDGNRLFTQKIRVPWRKSKVRRNHLEENFRSFRIDQCQMCVRPRYRKKKSGRVCALRSPGWDRSGSSTSPWPTSARPSSESTRRSARPRRSFCSGGTPLQLPGGARGRPNIPPTTKDRANWTGLVLGCIETKFCKKICVWKLSPRSTPSTPLHCCKFNYVTYY